jgi:NAD(P)H-dependent FMN reductase
MSKPHIVIVSSSLSANSRTRVMCKHAEDWLENANASIDFIDLAHYSLLPYPRSEDEAYLKTLVQRFNRANGWILATPIYNFGISGTMRDFLHYSLDSDLERYKPFLILAAAGGPRSYMAANDLAQAMIYEVFGIQIGPPIVAIKDMVVAKTGHIDDDIRLRLDRGFSHLLRIARLSATPSL